MNIGIGISLKPYSTAQFSPSDISGLKLWLRSDLGITLNGSTVSAWADQSGNSNHVSQATAANQPTYVTNQLNGQPILDFDGTNDVLTGTFGAALTGVKNWTLIAVMKADVVTGVRIPVSLGGNAAGYEFTINAASSAKREITCKGAAVVTDGNATTSYEVWTGTRDNGGTPNLVLRINGTSQTLSAPTTGVSTLAASAAIGANYTAGFFDGKIAEILVYNQDISGASLNQVHSYLGTRYGITVA